MMYGAGYSRLGVAFICLSQLEAEAMASMHLMEGGTPLETLYVWRQGEEQPLSAIIRLVDGVMAVDSFLTADDALEQGVLIDREVRSHVAAAVS